MRHDPDPIGFADEPLDATIARLMAGGLRAMQARQAVKQLARGFLCDGKPWDEAVDALSKPARQALRKADCSGLQLAEKAREVAADGTCRLALQTADGHLVETVLIPNHIARTGATTRTTVCVSSQVGCGRGCAFCETARVGLLRQLTSAEIVAQVRAAAAAWREVGGQRPPITNVVFMGMGEPLDNLTAVVSAIDVLRHDLAFGLSHRRITVSTVGVASRFRAFFTSTNANLAVSLNAPDDVRRARVMPAGRRTTMADIRAALLAHLPRGRDVLIEYVLFDGFNDADADADLLRKWLEGVPARLNLIPANPGPDPALREPDPDTVRAFQRRLLDAGVRTMIRYPHGRAVGGACGQLAGGLRGAT